MREALRTELHRRDPAAAVDLGRRALDAAVDAGDMPNRIGSLSLLARGTMALGRMGEARTLVEECIALSAGAGDHAMLAGAKMLLAFISQEQGDLYASAELCDESLRLFTALDDKREMARVAAYAGQVYFRLGQVSRGFDYNQRALAYWEEIGEMEHAGPTLGGLAQICQSLGEYDKSLEYHTRALEIARGRGDVVNEAGALSGQAGALIDLKNYGAAFAKFEEALAICRRHDLRREEASIWMGIGTAHGREDRSQQALRSFLKSRELFEKIGNTSQVIRLATRIATAHTMLGDDDAALAELDASLPRAEELGIWDVIVSIHRQRSEIFERRGELDRALESHKRLTELRQKEQSERSQKLVAWLQSRLDLERSERERETLALNNRHLELEVRQISKEISAMALNLRQRDEMLAIFKKHLAEAVDDDAEKMRAIIQRLSAEITSADGVGSWPTFMGRLDELHAEFTKRLAAAFPSLTPAEIKVCSLLRANLSTKEIAQLLAVSARSIEDHRYAIRRKLALPAGVNLVAFLAGY